MRVGKTVFCFLIFLAWGCPLTLRAQVPLPFETPAAVTEGEVRELLKEYVARYMNRDVHAFMALFSREAVENRMFPRGDIREIYRGYFSNSDALSYRLKIYSVQTYTRKACVSGHYLIGQFLKGSGSEQVYHGDIQWIFVREDEGLRILGLNYGRERVR